MLFSVPLSPVAFFPLNGQYETTDISHRSNPPAQASGVELAPGPDGNAGGSYQFSGNSSSSIYFPNNRGLDTRYSMTFLAWIYNEQTEGCSAEQSQLLAQTELRSVRTPCPRST